MRQTQDKLTRYESLETFRAEVEKWEAANGRKMTTFVRELESGQIGIVIGSSAWRGIPEPDQQGKLEKWLKARGAIRTLGVADRSDILN